MSEHMMKGRLLMYVWAAVALGVITLLSGCGGAKYEGQLQTFAAPASESEWIRNGEPITFDNALWYPQDDVEVLRDSEMVLMGTYRGVQFFTEKVDIRPFSRLYTKFGNHKYRFFVQKHD